MNSESVRIFQRVWIGASTSTDARVNSSAMAGFSLKMNISGHGDSMIGKTRQGEKAILETVYDPKAGMPRGVLKALPAVGKFRHARRTPAVELAHCIAHYWLVSWDLRGHEPHMQ